VVSHLFGYPFFIILSRQGPQDYLSRKEVTEVKKVIFPVILPILFILCTRSVFKPGYEIISGIIVVALGIVFGCLANAMIIQPTRDKKVEE
jgi:hypothetical protein